MAGREWRRVPISGQDRGPRERRICAHLDVEHTAHPTNFTRCCAGEGAPPRVRLAPVRLADAARLPGGELKLNFLMVKAVLSRGTHRSSQCRPRRNLCPAPAHMLRYDARTQSQVCVVPALSESSDFFCLIWSPALAFRFSQWCETTRWARAATLCGHPCAGTLNVNAHMLVHWRRGRVTGGPCA
jgi:hypothetical protein